MSGSSGLCLFLSVYGAVLAIAGVCLLNVRLQQRPEARGTRWPSEGGVNCSSLHEVSDLEFIAAGWTKAVYKGRFRGSPVAVKTVNLSGHDMKRCLEDPDATMADCYQRTAAKLLRELVILDALQHDNVVKVLGSCIPDSVGPVAVITELGDPLDTVRLLQLPWEDRLRLALGIAELLHHLAQSPLGPVVLNDFRHQQFVVVGGELKLTDADDVGVGEAAAGDNERLNAARAARQLLRLLLPPAAPAALEPPVRALLAAYERPDAAPALLRRTRALVHRFAAGRYRRPAAHAEFERISDSDMPGLFDYRCHQSISSAGCVVSVVNEAEAAELCEKTPECQAVVLSQQHTWTGRKLAILKNSFGQTSYKEGYTILRKMKSS